eukprot:GHVP01054217.1.p1 GENE.GHVP01054217.1~~GHVP01054217.1.p1  ORF type:complete len:755 (-),score=132.18 GHVP01054217.1:18-2282(-)
MNILCVAEKNSASRGIANILSGGLLEERGKNKVFKRVKNGVCHDIIMTCVAGHMTELSFDQAVSKSWDIDPKLLLVLPIYNTLNPTMQEFARNIKEGARKCSVLMIWTDCDREGEHIGGQIVDIARSVNPNIQVQRAKYSAIENEEIIQAFERPGLLNLKSVQAVECRREFDIRTGFALTRFQTISLQKKFTENEKSVISYGPCQFPTLGFIVEQYKRTKEFISEDFWSISVSAEKNGIKCDFSWERKRLFDKQVVGALFSRCIENKKAIVIKLETSLRQKIRPLPLTTTSLQKSINRIFKISPKNIMNAAERLYNKGYVSYPRTETESFSRSMNLKGLIKKQFDDSRFGSYAKRLIDSSEFLWPRAGKKNDEAHPPIHPVKPSDFSIEGEEAIVYDFIARSFLGSCSVNAEGLETAVTIDINGEIFTSKGINVTKLGYLEVYRYDKWDSKEIPKFEKGEEFLPKSISLEQGKTTAPRLLTEADLIGLMEKHGIGTDATIHEHIEKMFTRKYATKNRDSTILPTSLGESIVDFYDAIGASDSLTQPFLRADIEKDLDRINKGEENKDTVLKKHLGVFERVYNLVEDNQEEMGSCFRDAFDKGAKGNTALPKQSKVRCDNKDTLKRKKIDGIGQSKPTNTISKKTSFATKTKESVNKPKTNKLVKKREKSTTKLQKPSSKPKPTKVEKPVTRGVRSAILPRGAARTLKKDDTPASIGSKCICGLQTLKTCLMNGKMVFTCSKKTNPCEFLKYADA